MRMLISFIVILMSTISLAQSLPLPQAITDPKQVQSKASANR